MDWATVSTETAAFELRVSRVIPVCLTSFASDCDGEIFYLLRTYPRKPYQNSRKVNILIANDSLVPNRFSERGHFYPERSVSTGTQAGEQIRDISSLGNNDRLRRFYSLMRRDGGRRFPGLCRRTPVACLPTGRAAPVQHVGSANAQTKFKRCGIFPDKNIEHQVNCIHEIGASSLRVRYQNWKTRIGF
jgi:hypothetical protein